jgi:Fe-S-cluster containining protein
MPASSHPDQQAMTVIARAYARYAEQASQWIERYTQQGGTVHCKSGCLHCCNLPIRVSLIEALLTATHLLPAQLEAMHSRAPEILENARHATNWNGYFAHHRQDIGYCPLLDQTTGACTAYEVRPGRCRDTYSAMSAHYCTVGTLEHLGRQERARYNHEVKTNPVTDGISHYIAPLEDLGTTIWDEASRTMREAWGLEVWGDFWVLTSLSQDEAFMGAVRAGQVKRARLRAKALGLWHIEIVQIEA